MFELELNSDELFVELKNSQIQFPQYMSTISNSFISSQLKKNNELFIVACGINHEKSKLELFTSVGELRVVYLNENEKYSKISINETGDLFLVYEKINEFEICIGRIPMQEILNDSVCILKIKNT
jgi:hypothetical protein